MVGIDNLRLYRILFVLVEILLDKFQGKNIVDYIFTLTFYLDICDILP